MLTLKDRIIAVLVQNPGKWLRIFNSISKFLKLDARHTGASNSMAGAV
jgi:hypothetical protein